MHNHSNHSYLGITNGRRSKTIQTLLPGVSAIDKFDGIESPSRVTAGVRSQIPVLP